MDFRNPVEAVIPGVHGRVLAVLLNSTGDLNVRNVARVAGVSVAQASRVLPGLVALGMVERHEVPPSSLFRLVPEHVASKALLALADSRRTFLNQLGTLVKTIRPVPTSVIVFGSVARGDSEKTSDIDLVVVLPVGRFNEERWSEELEKFRLSAQTASGNKVEILEVEVVEAHDRLAARRGVWRDIRRDGIVVFGSTLAELLA
jgi:predicted nucleotidyltransferase